MSENNSFLKSFIQITKALSDEHRVRALMLLQGGELCLCQIIEVLGLSPSTVSKHMTKLCQAGLVEYRKEGRWRYYRLSSEQVSSAAEAATRWVQESLAHDKVVAGDARHLKIVLKKEKSLLVECYRR